MHFPVAFSFRTVFLSKPRNRTLPLFHSRLVLVVIGLSLSSSNLLGYLRCRMGNTENASVTDMANSYMRTQMLSNLTSYFTGANRGNAGSTNMQAGMNNVI